MSGDDHVAQEVVETVVKFATVGADFLKSLIGKTVDEAKRLVQDSGLVAREVKPDEMTDMMVLENRVNLRTKDGVVDEADVG